MAVKHNNRILFCNKIVIERFQHYSFHLSDLLDSTKLFALYLENSGLGPQTVQDMTFQFAKCFSAKVPDNGVLNNVEISMGRKTNF